MRRAFICVGLAAIVVAVGYCGSLCFALLDGSAHARSLHACIARGETDRVRNILRWDRRLTESIDAPISQRKPLQIAAEFGQLGPAQAQRRSTRMSLNFCAGCADSDNVNG